MYGDQLHALLDFTIKHHQNGSFSTIIYKKRTLIPTPSKLPGNYPCGAPRCKTCPILKVTDLKFRASCKSFNIVYLITCRKCGLQYVSETSQSLHARINGHRLDIMHRRTDVSPIEIVVVESPSLHIERMKGSDDSIFVRADVIWGYLGSVKTGDR